MYRPTNSSDIVRIPYSSDKCRRERRLHRDKSVCVGIESMFWHMEHGLHSKMNNLVIICLENGVSLENLWNLTPTSLKLFKLR